MIRQNRIVIDLDAIKHNYELMKQQVGPDVRVMAAVKANAYGHGIVEVSRTVTAAGCNDLAVALAEEGVLLRENGITANILILGAATEIATETAIMQDLIQTVFEPEMVAYIEEEAMRLGKTAYVHIKLDTGMGRIGLRTEGEADALALALKDAPHVEATGIYTHFADADNLRPLRIYKPHPKRGDNQLIAESGELSLYTQKQLQRFHELRSHFDPSIPIHVSNSAMSLVAPEANYSMIREGISLYGYPPVPTKLGFRHALRWETEIVFIKEIGAGVSISYGCTFTTEKPTRVATVAVGYGDGYHRLMSNRGQMLVAGKRANILGRICMDQTMIDVTDIPEAKIGSQVTLIGSQGNETIDAEELATWAETISYEVLLAITTRVPRTYLPVK